MNSININEKNIREYLKSVGINYKKASDQYYLFYKLKEEESIKKSYLDCLSNIINNNTFNVYKYLLNYDLQREDDYLDYFLFISEDIEIQGVSNKALNRHLNCLNKLGMINKARSKNGNKIEINYDFILNNLLINNLYNDRLFFNKLSLLDLEKITENNLNEYIIKNINSIHKTIIDSFKKDFTEEQINKVLAKLYQFELNNGAKKASFINIGDYNYIYYNLKEHVTNRDVQILNYLVLTDKVSCITINGLNRYRIIDKSNIKLNSIEQIEMTSSVEEKDITNEVDSGSLTKRQKEGIINTLDKFLNENDIEISDNKYKLLLKYGYYLKSRNISEFSYLAYIKEIITQKFDDNKLNYIVTDMINKNFTNLFNYLDKNNISPKTNATEIITTEVKTTQTSSNNNPLTKLTREEFAKLQEGRSGGKLYEEIDEYKAQGKTEVEYIKDKLGIDVSKR